MFIEDLSGFSYRKQNPLFKARVTQYKNEVFTICLEGWRRVLLLVLKNVFQNNPVEFANRRLNVSSTRKQR